jgi:Transposase
MKQTLAEASVCSPSTTAREVIGIDLGDRWSRYCVVNQAGTVVEENRVRTTPEALQAKFGELPATRIVMEVGAHSPWVNRLLQAQGHDVVVANPRKVRLIYESDRKNDRLDARMLARLGRVDVSLLSPVQHRSREVRADLALVRSRDALVMARTQPTNSRVGCELSRASYDRCNFGRGRGGALSDQPDDDRIHCQCDRPAWSPELHHAQLADRSVEEHSAEATRYPMRGARSKDNRAPCFHDQLLSECPFAREWSITITRGNVSLRRGEPLQHSTCPCGAARQKQGESIVQTIWLSPTGFVTGDPTLQISYPSVSHPSTVITCTSPGDLKWVSIGLPLPQNITIHEVTVCYELSNAGSFISQVRLVEMSTPNQGLVRHDDPTDLKSTSPTCYNSKVVGFTPSVAIILELRLKFRNTSDEIRLGAVGVTFESGVGCCVNSIADLKALHTGAVPCLTVLGYYAPGDGGGGDFYWDASSIELDNGGTTIAPTSNPAAAGRWKRLVHGPISVKWFGAKGDGQTNPQADDSRNVQSAINAIQVVGGTLFFPVGTYQLKTNVDFPVAISAAFDNGATLAPISGVVVTMNSRIRAGLYKVFTIGAGLVRGFSNVPYLLPQWWGAKADGNHDDGPAIQAALDASR